MLPERQERGADAMIALPTASVDLDHHRVLRPDGEVSLTQLEVDALRHLAARPGQVIGRAELEQEVWRMGRGARSEAVPVAMRRLRQKVGADGLVTVRGEGWRLALQSTAAPAARLPAFTTPFVGREALLSELHRRFSEGWRLVTLRGPGGVGKTRLATELARTWPGEVVSVAGGGLGPGPDALPMALAEALGLMAGEPAALARALEARRRPLILLDDAEDQTAGAGAALAALLAEAPGAAALVTSRVALDAPGESVLEVTPFPPALAIRFFADRAAGPALDPAGAALAELTALLDGLPGSLELYAGRAELGVEELLIELRQGQQAPSLDEQVERSWRGLGPEDQAALLACSVYVGAFSRVYAAQDAGLDGRRLAELRRRSLLQLDPQGRLFLLATVRRFCARQPGFEAAGRRAREGALSRAEALALALPSQPERSLEGLREALPTLLELAAAPDPVGAARAALAADALLALTGPAERRLGLLESIPWSETADGLRTRGQVALARARRVAGRPAAEVRRALEGAEGPDAALVRGELAGAAGDHEGALRCFAEAVASSPPGASAGLIARARRCSTAWIQNTWPTERIDADLAEGLAQCEASGARLYLPELLRSAGLLAKARGDRRAARHHLARALQLAEAQGQIRMVGDLWCTLGMVWFDDRLRQAEACFSRALQHSIEHGDTAFIALFQLNLGSTLLLLDRPTDALALLDAAIPRLRGDVALQTCHLARATALFALNRPLDAEIALDALDPSLIGAMYSPRAAPHGELLIRFARAEALLRRLGQDPAAAGSLRALVEEAREEARRERATALRAMLRRVEERLSNIS